MIMLGTQTCASLLAVRIGPTQGIDHATSDIRLRGCAFGGDVAILGSQCSNTFGAIAPNQHPAAASPAPAYPATSIPDQKLDAAAAAMQRVASLKRDYLQQLEAASPDDQPRIAGEAGNALEKAVTDEGLSVEEYTTILEMAQANPQVRQKIIERMQAPASLD
jgi:hypothetical protein